MLYCIILKEKFTRNAVFNMFSERVSCHTHPRDILRQISFRSLLVQLSLTERLPSFFLVIISTCNADIHWLSTDLRLLMSEV